mmetsp:Transcript_88553/g.255424  ORF Transcript_88553/g.255424 Transcript_88553/m.255424 type:complete len:234 (-) Transcript_88553:194-895(-)
MPGSSCLARGGRHPSSPTSCRCACFCWPACHLRRRCPWPLSCLGRDSSCPARDRRGLVLACPSSLPPCPGAGLGCFDPLSRHHRQPTSSAACRRYFRGLWRLCLSSLSSFLAAGDCGHRFCRRPCLSCPGCTGRRPPDRRNPPRGGAGPAGLPPARPANHARAGTGVPRKTPVIAAGRTPAAAGVEHHAPGAADRMPAAAAEALSRGSLGAASFGAWWACSPSLRARCRHCCT